MEGEGEGEGERERWTRKGEARFSVVNVLGRLMGESSGSVSIDVERISLGGKVRLLDPLAFDFFLGLI